MRLVIFIIDALVLISVVLILGSVYLSGFSSGLKFKKDDKKITPKGGEKKNG